MKAAVYDRYGPPEVVSVGEVERPAPGETDVLVGVVATTVTTADWRFRASAFPPAFWLFGRAMAGLFRPRNKVLGGEFAGRVVSVGDRAKRFRPGDAVFGFAGAGAHAEYVRMAEDGAIAAKPANLGYDEAAAVPFGALAALVFLRDLAKIEPGESILITGASGGVGVYAVQLAKHFGAEVTAVTSTANVDLVRSLGADEVVDYTKNDVTRSEARFDVILDPVGRTSFTAWRHLLKPKGRHAFLEFGLRQVVQAMLTGIAGGQKVIIGVNGDRREDLEFIAGLLERGEIRPVIDSRHAIEQIAEAHRRVEGRHKTGSVVVTVSDPTETGPDDERARKAMA